MWETTAYVTRAIERISSLSTGEPDATTPAEISWRWSKGLKSKGKGEGTSDTQACEPRDAPAAAAGSSTSFHDRYLERRRQGGDRPNRLQLGQCRRRVRGSGAEPGSYNSVGTSTSCKASASAVGRYRAGTESDGTRIIGGVRHTYDQRTREWVMYKAPPTAPTERRLRSGWIQDQVENLMDRAHRACPPGFRPEPPMGSVPAPLPLAAPTGSALPLVGYAPDMPPPDYVPREEWPAPPRTAQTAAAAPKPPPVEAKTPTQAQIAKPKAVPTQKHLGTALPLNAMPPDDTPKPGSPTKAPPRSLVDEAAEPRPPPAKDPPPPQLKAPPASLRAEMQRQR